MAATEAAQSTLSLEIWASGSSKSTNGRRSWTVIVDGLPGRPAQGDTLEDPFTIAAYEAYEQWLRKKSERRHHPSKSLLEDPSLWWKCPPDLQRDDTVESETASVSTHQTFMERNPPSITEYREKLRRVLQLDTLQRYSRIKVYVCEDVDPKHEWTDDHSSIHSLMWELLEPYDTETTLPSEDGSERSSPEPKQKVEVHRIFTGAQSSRELAAGLRSSDAPIRLLLVIARALQVDVKKKFVDIRSVVHDTLCLVRKYLRKCGRHDRLYVDVVRPGTLGELEEQLRRGGTYDLVHLDVHGQVTGNGTPTDDEHSEAPHSPTEAPLLLFAKPDLSEATQSIEGHVSFTEEVFTFVRAEEIADLLARHDIAAVALSACLSSWAQGKPLSNMCRVFASRGMRVITGISFTAWSDKAEAYYAGFYPALLLANYGFRGAAVQGRLSLLRRLVAEHRLAQKQQDARREREEQREHRKQPAEFAPRGRRPRRKIGKEAANNAETEEAKHTYPTVTTYYTAPADKKFDRTNSARLGVDLDATAGAGQTDASWLTGFWSRHPRLWARFSPVLRRLLPARLMTPADELATFEAFRARARHRSRLHSVGLMALEARLKALDRLYIHMDGAAASRPQLLRDVGDSWLETNFAGRVEVASASYFRWRLLDGYLRLWLWLRIVGGRVRDRWSWWGRGGGRDSSGAGKKTVLIIDRVESIFHKGVPKDMRAVKRMDWYISAVEKLSEAGLYLIIMGTDTTPYLELDADEYPWVTAQSFQAQPGLVVFCAAAT